MVIIIIGGLLGCWVRHRSQHSDNVAALLA
jgi:hypothetical protein